MANTTHHFVIEPLKGVGPICFGMHKDEVSKAFTYVYTSFFKGSTSKIRSDHCEIVGLIIHYNDDCRVDYIEITKPKYATITLELFGQDITGISVQDAVKLLASHSPKYSKDVYGYDFPDLGLNLFNSDLQSEADAVECFGIASNTAT
jgi:hypothetical protein